VKLRHEPLILKLENLTRPVWINVYEPEPGAFRTVFTRMVGAPMPNRPTYKPDGLLYRIKVIPK
jgi:hypothetical protein